MEIAQTCRGKNYFIWIEHVPIIAFLKKIENINICGAGVVPPLEIDYCLKIDYNRELYRFKILVDARRKKYGALCLSRGMRF